MALVRIPEVFKMVCVGSQTSWVLPRYNLKPVPVHRAQQDAKERGRPCKIW